MPRLRRINAGVAATCTIIAGCGLGPVVPPRDAAPEVLRISTHTWIELTPGRSDHTDVLPGAQCTASNDLGSWSLSTPGELRVQRSKARLRIECRKDGYRDAHVELGCLTPRSQAAMGGARGALAMASLAGPVAVVALPAVGLIVAAVGGTAVLGAAGGSALAGTQSDADLCAYGAAGALEVWMRKAN